MLSLRGRHRSAEPAKGFLVEVAENTCGAVADGASAFIAENFLDVTGDGPIPSVQNAVYPFIAMIAVIGWAVGGRIASHTIRVSCPSVESEPLQVPGGGEEQKDYSHFTWKRPGSGMKVKRKEWHNKHRQVIEIE